MSKKRFENVNVYSESQMDWSGVKNGRSLSAQYKSMKNEYHVY